MNTNPIALTPTRSLEPALDLSNVIAMPVKKRAVQIGGHKTSISLEDPFWFMLKQLAVQQHVCLCELLSQIDSRLEESENLSSACRLYVLAWMQAQIGFLKQSPPDPPERAA